MNCDAKSSLTAFGGESFTLEHAGQTVTLEALSGWRCGECGEVEFDAKSAQRYALAGDALVLDERTRHTNSHKD